MDINSFLEKVEFKNHCVTGSPVVVTEDSMQFTCKAPDSNLYVKRLNSANDSLEYRLSGDYKGFNFAAALKSKLETLHIVVDLKDSPDGITLQRLINNESELGQIFVKDFTKSKVLDVFETVKQEIDKGLENKTLSKLSD
jgi:hypothetical protein